jgi:tight adherence protein C
MAWIAAAGVIGYAVMFVFAWRTRGSAPFHWLMDPFAAALRHRAVWERAQPLLFRQQMELAVLNGGICSKDTLLRWAAEGCGTAYALSAGAVALGWAADNAAAAGVGVLIGATLPVLKANQLRDRVGRRRQMIMLELPELLNRLLLLTGAGEQPMRALSRCLEHKRGTGHPLYEELSAALEALKRGESMGAALEEFGRRCAVPEVKLFTSTLLSNAKLGGETLIPSLRELTRILWEKRKAAARTLGEQASSKLAFPLAVIFLLIMALVGAPALLLM